ncbi:acyltransferase [Alteromonas oceanisediminis]|uniref:acyltransferase n=1 Tax=Alteromonas oceanisediminis TaxID=2836180 RepID=UPI001BD93A41|nr:acyltransferase [Alteromonas oceanisediminis]MBT0585870.1 acyltransferase [Alteromonas oceanisediminis]
MLKQLGHNIIGTVSVIGYFVNTVFWCIPIFCLSLLKVIPISPWRKFISHILDGCATNWITLNNVNQNMTGRTRFEVAGIDQLSVNDWYLVIANHQSWVDILILQRVFNRRIPFLKFFLKKELIWVPFLGLAWWALDFPFMRRYSKSFLAKHPHLKGKDLETTRRACEKFRYKPVSVMNFIEGTRFTPAKHARQNSPFTHLLKPRAGGVAFVLSSMGSQLHKLVNVTIYYPGGIPSFWDFVCGKVDQVRVQVSVTPVADLFKEKVFHNDYFDDPRQRAVFQQWLNKLWQDKDAQLSQFNTQ